MVTTSMLQSLSDLSSKAISSQPISDETTTVSSLITTSTTTSAALVGTPKRTQLLDLTTKTPLSPTFTLRKPQVIPVTTAPAVNCESQNQVFEEKSE
ncbi:unnamed protein product [Didymodactylos carnosus]|uniref:Uncharacterized protein n=1 Tax=Didymodactylos carnosus TaxID=1234261 RepID=A0A816DR46_9BILA|nr:unnamed protein product [Didymodactylos carnosus]CAF4544795.1 unnamed protein product [Didymodactylos carnosus]